MGKSSYGSGSVEERNGSFRLRYSIDGKKIHQDLGGRHHQDRGT